jgi:hypothetical protein
LRSIHQEIGRLLLSSSLGLYPYSAMKKFLILVLGWILTVVGAILTPVPLPLPVPFPIGITMLLVGCSILTTHSKPFRRGVQYIRHHNGWLSRGLEWVTKHTSDIVEKMAHRFSQGRKGKFSRGFAAIAGRSTKIMRNMVHRTRPHAHGRHARIKSRRADDPA